MHGGKWNGAWRRQPSKQLHHTLAGHVYTTGANNFVTRHQAEIAEVLCEGKAETFQHSEGKTLKVGFVLWMSLSGEFGARVSRAWHLLSRQAPLGSASSATRTDLSGRASSSFNRDRSRLTRYRAHCPTSGPLLDQRRLPALEGRHGPFSPVVGRRTTAHRSRRIRRAHGK